MDLYDEKSIIAIIINSYNNYLEKLNNRVFLYVYKDHENKYQYEQVHFTKRHFKHLCGISDDEEDVIEYTKKGIIKKITTSKQFYKLIEKRKLSPKHIILKKDGSSKQKINIINNIDKVTNRETLYYCTKQPKGKNALKCDYMIGLKNGNITLAMGRKETYSYPKSSLEYGLSSETDDRFLFPIEMVFEKELNSRSKYKRILIGNAENIKLLPTEIQELISIETD